MTSMSTMSTTTSLSYTQAVAATSLPSAPPAPNTHTLHTCTVTSSSSYSAIDYLVYLPLSWSPNSSSPSPVVLFLHGAEEVNKGKVLCRAANGRKSLVDDGAWRLRTVPGMLPALVDQINDGDDDASDTTTTATTFPFILVSPQCPKAVRFGSSTALMDDIVRLVSEDVCGKYNGDVSNVFVTGLSMGGYGTWEIATRHSTFFKAAAPICGGFSGFQESILNLQGVWVFHGREDSIVPCSQSDLAVKQLKKAVEMQEMFGLSLLDLEVENNPEQEQEQAEQDQQHVQKARARPPIEIKYTRYDSSPSPAPNMRGHGSWIQAYFESDLLQWFYGMTTQ